MSEREVIKRDLDKREEEMYADMESDGDRVERKEIVMGEKLEARIGAKAFVCGDEVGERGVFAITDKTWLTEGEEERRWK